MTSSQPDAPRPDERNRVLTGSRLTMTDSYTFERHYEDELVDYWTKGGSIEAREPTVAEVQAWLALRAGGQPVSATPEPNQDAIDRAAAVMHRLHFGDDSTTQWKGEPEKYRKVWREHAAEVLAAACEVTGGVHGLVPERIQERSPEAEGFGIADAPGQSGNIAPTVTMPLAVAQRVYWAIIAMPVELSPELCEATEAFHRHITAPQQADTYEMAGAVLRGDRKIEDVLKELAGVSATPPEPDARLDEMAEWIVLETTDAKWADLTERERNRFRRCVRLFTLALTR